MKKTFTQILMLSVIGLCLSSCSRFSNLSVTKRHYRGGYNIETYSLRNPSKIHETRELEEKIPQSTITDQRVNQQNLAKLRSIAPETSARAISVKSVNHTVYPTENLQPAFRNSMKEPEVNRSAFHKNTMVSMERKYEGEGRHGLGGILWFIVVLLLILFLLNFILTLNLGGLVYIILVIALILLLFRLIGML